MKEDKHIKKYRKKHLSAGEEILTWCSGYVGSFAFGAKEPAKEGALIITKTKVIFYRAGLTSEIHESIPLANISAVDTKSKLGFKTITISTSNNDIVFKTIDAEGTKQVLETLNACIAAKANPTAAVEESPLEKLKKLGELKEAGVVTEAEFMEKKKELLAAM